MKDGRVFKGEILSFNENNGTIIFKNQDGSKYTFKQEEYTRYKENVAFDAKNDFELRPRKESGFEIQVGFSGVFMNQQPNFTADEYYINGADSYGGMPLGVKFGAGTYLNRQNFIGGSVELGFTSNPKNYLSVGARYFYQYDGYKKNVAFYLPVELHFTTMQDSYQFSTSDTNFVDNNGSWTYPSYKDIKTKMSMVSLSFGQGLSFILHNKKAIGVEISFVKYFILNTRFEDAPKKPNTDFSINGFKLALLYSI
jgi:hypothetical protein